MSSGGSKTQQQTTSHDPPSWAVPYFHQGLNMAGKVANQPFQPYEGQMVAGLTPDQLAAQQMVRQQAGNTATLDAGTGFVSGLLGGQGGFNAQQNRIFGKANPFAGENPHLQQMIDRSSRDVTDAYNRSAVPNMMAQFNAGGAFGGTAHMDAMNQSEQALARELGDLSNQYRFQDYQTQQGLAESALNRDAALDDAHLGRQQQAWDTHQGRQMQALGLIPGLEQAGYIGAQQLGQQGLQQQLTNQAGLDSAYEEFLRGQGWDSQQLGALANMLGTVQGGSSTANVANPNYRSATQNAITAAAIVASFMSDEDAKTDKQPMDPEKGLEAIRRMPFESWRYHGDTEQHAGTYSQDFYNALGMQPKREINSIDMFGALGGAVKALDKKVNGKRARK